MPTVINNINNKKRGRGIFEPEATLMRILPAGLFYELSKWSTYGIEEIRCRLNRRTYITCGGKNIPIDHITSSDEMATMLDCVCGDSMYAYRETLAQGYVTLGDGVRVGVCGSAVLEKGAVTGVYDVTSLNFRIPSPLLTVGAEVETLIRSSMGGVLVYSPAGEGKTTLLRALISRLSAGSNPLRVCVVDTRRELSAQTEEWGECADLLIGYPKSIGIDIATRTMNAELIVCDEIGAEDEARAILGAQNCGIPLLATTHGRSLSDIFRRECIRALHKSAVFENYVGIMRKRGGDFIYTVTRREDADAFY